MWIFFLYSLYNLQVLVTELLVEKQKHENKNYLFNALKHL